MKKNDILLFVGIFIVSAALFAGYRLFSHQTGDFVTITVDGKVLKTLPLNEDTALDISGANGGSNHLEIKNGTASITDADCPDKLCVHQKEIKNQGESLICLPHKVIVQVSSSEKRELDDVAN